MSGVSGLDLRFPIGALFTVLGLVLAGYGLATGGDAAHYERSLNVNINLWWGIIMLAFGVLMLLAAMRSRTPEGAHPAAETPGGRETEAREHELGLER